MNALQKLSDATRMLSEVRDAKDAKKLMDLADAARYYAQKAKLGKESIDYAHSIRIEAQSLLGGYLKTAEKAKGGNPKLTGRVQRQVENPTVAQVSTLAELGLTRDESAAAQILYTIKKAEPAEFEQVRAGKTTLAAVKRKAKEKTREKRRSENRKKVEQVPDPVASGAKFATIVIDPPWDWGDEGDVNQMGRAKPDYATMSIEQLMAQPVGEMADTDCHLYLWITNRSLPKGFALLEKWGFRYVTALTWVKPHFGMGNYFVRSNAR